MAISVTDGGAPGRMDTLDWKWYAAGSTVSLEDLIEMGSLCDRGPKDILAGNLVVHLAPTGKTKAKANRSI